MTDLEQLRTDERVLRALADLKRGILERYPTATFEVSVGGEPEGIYLDAIVDLDDTGEVLEPIMDRLLEVQIDEGLPVYVVPLRPLPTISDPAERASADAPRRLVR